jgi:hypothetical protein
MNNTAPFEIDPARTAIAVAYRNPAYIAGLVLPPVPVNRQEFKWQSFDLAEDFTPPATEISRRGSANEVEFGSTELTDRTQDHGLDDFVPQNDIDNAGENQDPVDRATVQTTELVLIRKEMRAAATVFAAGNYDASCKVQLSGNDQWSASHADSTPIADIETGLNACLIRPNTAVFGQETWSVLRRHPQIVSAVLGNNGTNGLVTRQQFADLFELQSVHVGVSRRNTAAKGQSPSLARIWGKHAAFLYLDPNADTNGGITFGYTATWRKLVVMTRPDPKRGGFGGTDVMVRESVKEKAIANRAGYYVQDAIA